MNQPSVLDGASEMSSFDLIDYDVPHGLVGRDDEVAFLGEAISSIRDAGAAVALRGAPGVGKSSVLKAAVAIAQDAGCQVLEATGVETESSLPFAGLHALLGPLLNDVELLPAVQKRALLAAFGIEEGSTPEMFLIALAALNLLTSRAARCPIVIVVDDMQWIDASTGEVLAFLARRIGQDAIVIVGAYRDGYTVALASAMPHELEVKALGDVASGELLKACGLDLGISETYAILKHAEGNPLALVELPRIALNTPGGGFANLARSLPLSARLESVFAARIREMPAITRDALLIGAINSEDNLSEILAGSSVLAGQEVTAAVLEPAERAQILRFDEMHVRFRHPLVRSGILQYESVARRQAANVALSEVLEMQPYRRVWHLAQGAQAPDDAVADELDIHHTESVRRGSLDTAIEMLERSAQLTSDPQKRVQRLLLAAQHAFGMGRADLVDRLVLAAEQDALSKLERARVEWLREIDNGTPGDANRILQLCDIAEESDREGDRDLALQLLLGAALRCFWADSGPLSRARVVEVAERLDEVQDDPRCIALIAIAEPILRGAQTMLRLDAISAESLNDPDQLRLLGFAARAIGAEHRAADFLARAETKLRDQGRIGLLAQVLAAQSSVWIDLGDWNRAVENLEEAQRLSSETGQPVWTSSSNGLTARIAGVAGDVERAMRHAAEVEIASSVLVNNVALASGQLGRGCAWISVGRHADAYDALRRLFDRSDPSHHQREQLSGLMFLAEAAIHCDQRDDARQVLGQMEEIAKVTTSPILHNQLLYARAVLADQRDAESLFEAGLAEDLTRWPWIRARIQLAYGSWLRRQRRVSESRQYLRSAAATLEIIGATAWAREATIELRAAGELGESRNSKSLTTELSPQELQIARLAAEGLTNKEIGERLYMSPRTVSSHLYRIYPKLGIRTRAQLASRLVAA